MKLNKFSFSLSQIIFIALIAAANVGFDMIVSPGLIALFGHIVVGVLVMVPINFIFISLTKHLVAKFGSLILYMLVFSAISIPTTFYGGVPGFYKVLAGLLVGIGLDLAFLPLKSVVKIFLGGILGAVVWWLATFSIWTLFQFPFVSSMSNLFNLFFTLTPWIDVPITGFGIDLFKFSLVCGLFSAIQVVVACIITYSIAKSIKKTAVYERFQTSGTKTNLLF